MKLLPFLLAGSLAANAAAVAAFALRPALAPTAIRELFITDAARAAAHAADQRARQLRTAAQSRTAAAQTAARRARLWSSLDSADLRTLVANLRAAGFSPAVIRAIAGARVEATFSARMSELVSSLEMPYWKPEPFSSSANPKFYEAQSQIYRDRTKALRELLGDDYLAGATGEVTADQRRRFGQLPKAKVDLIQRILDDYGEMTVQVRAATQGITLPEDREKFALLEREKRADLAAVLTPAELEDYEMRNSPMLQRSRTALTLMNASEAEFHAIYRAHLPFAEILNATSLPGIGSETIRQRNEAQVQVAEQIRRALGEARYADYSRASNYEYQNLHRLAQREGIALDAINRAYDLRISTTGESMRIHEARLPPDERQAALQALATATRNKLIASLGHSVAENYAKTAGWISGIERGYAIKFGPDGTSTIYYSSPPPPPPPRE